MSYKFLEQYEIILYCVQEKYVVCLIYSDDHNDSVCIQNDISPHTSHYWPGISVQGTGQHYYSLAGNETCGSTVLTLKND